MLPEPLFRLYFYGGMEAFYEYSMVSGTYGKNPAVNW